MNQERRWWIWSGVIVALCSIGYFWPSPERDDEGPYRHTVPCIGRYPFFCASWLAAKGPPSLPGWRLPDSSVAPAAVPAKGGWSRFSRRYILPPRGLPRSEEL
jgi:hypothetical protein